MEDVDSFGKASLERAEEILEEGRGNSALKVELTNRALASERIDLARLCFERNSTWAFFSRSLLEIPDSQFRDKVLVMALESDSYFWPNEVPVLYGRDRRYDPSLDGLFEIALKKYYPDEVFDPKTTENKKGRLRLAARLENAIAGHYPDQDRTPKKGSAEASPPGDAVSNYRGNSGIFLGIPEAPSEIARSPYVWATCLGVLGLFALWMRRSSRRETGR